MAFDPRKLTVLETTLRDGSYVIDFQFTAEDTRRLAGALDRLGFLLIEIGHGLGINAGATASRRWASPDVEHIRAAKAAARTAKIGMFCIPGIARLEDLHACIDAGLDFVRIGANVDQVETTASFIKEARRRGIWVCTNFMKSYAMPPGEFREVCKRSAGYGSEMLYLVDSAGGMLPDEVTTYVAAM
ncbi:MAG: 4-hydroxy-2-oxovalerate aldolase, partial [Alphaproteobacteria bacterium]|nr:4-hydroxy-2-oxovalerate aldolase [Alphaproteobacteria bacterium]